MQIAISDQEIEEFMEIINRIAQDHPILVDKYLQGKEIEVDAVCDGTDILIPGIMEHIERTGVHSGDSISVYPAHTIGRLVKEKMRAGERTGIICSEETRPLYQADHIEVMGPREDKEAAARHLYAALRRFDSRKIDYIYSEEFSGNGVGMAVMNRLLKAAGHRILQAK